MARDAVNRGDHLKANTLLRAAKVMSPTEIEKMLREVTVRSLPLDFGKYLLVVARSLAKGVSPQDIVREDVCKEFNVILRDELSYRDVNSERLAVIKESLRRWKSRTFDKSQSQGLASLSEVAEFDPSPTLREALQEYIEMKLTEKCSKGGVPDQMVHLLIDHIEGFCDAFMVDISITEREESIFLGINLFGTFFFGEYSVIEEELSKQTRTLRRKIEKCMDEDDLADSHLRGDNVLIAHSFYPSVELKLGIGKEQILLDGIEFLPEKKRELESLFFQKLFPLSIEQVKIKNLKRECENALKSGDLSRAYELNKVQLHMELYKK